MAKHQGPKVLVLDIETLPMELLGWGIRDQNFSIEQIKEDWSLAAWAAKWLGDSDSKTIYMDVSKNNNLRADKKITGEMAKLLDEADVVLTQNGKFFDIPKLNAKIQKHGFKKPSSFKHIDTFQLTRKNFGLTSYKLAYLCEYFGVKQKKSDHKEFPGFLLWKECLAKNKNAWTEMRKYNIQDVLALEALYLKIQQWQTSVNFNLWRDEANHTCNCGSNDIQKYGIAYTASGKFQRYQCNSCGAESRGKVNLFSKEKCKSIRSGLT